MSMDSEVMPLTADEEAADREDLVDAPREAPPERR